MADVTEESGEIDDFAIFRARSLGVESEYLVLAKAGQLRGSPRVQRDPKATTTTTAADPEQTDPQTPSRRRHASGGRPRNLHSTRCSDDARCDSPSLSLRDNSCSPKVRRATPYTRSDSTKTETLETRNELFPLEEEGRLQRAHSYRSRRSPQPQLGGGQYLLGPDGDQTESSKFNRSRTMTMPARRKPAPGRIQRGDASSECSSPARRTGTTGSRSSFRGGVEADTNGNRTPSLGDVFVDRAVLRVRNFSTKSGNIVNRGDSIKIRGGREARSREGGWSTPSGSGGGTRPPSLRNENGGIGQHETPLASPVRPSLSRHSSRGSYKYHAAEPEYVISLEGGGGGIGGGGFPSSPSRSSHNLLCPLSYPLNGGGYAEEDEEIGDNTGDDDFTTQHLTVNCAEGVAEGGGRKGRVTEGARRTETEDEAEVYKVLVLGSQGVGKTTLTKQLLTSEYLANNENDFGE